LKPGTPRSERLPPKSEIPVNKILVAFDGSESATRALRYAIEQVAGDPDRSIHLLIAHADLVFYPPIGVAIPYETMMKAADRESAEALAPAEKALKEAGVTFSKEIRRGSPAALIAERAKPEEFAGIVMGTRGMGAVQGLVMGSVATQVVHLAEVPVTLVK